MLSPSSLNLKIEVIKILDLLDTPVKKLDVMEKYGKVIVLEQLQKIPI